MPRSRQSYCNRSKTPNLGPISALTLGAVGAACSPQSAPAILGLNVQAAQAAGRAGLLKECRGAWGSSGGEEHHLPTLPCRLPANFFGRQRLRFGLSTSTASLSAAWPLTGAQLSHPQPSPKPTSCCQFPPSFPPPPSYLPYSPVCHPSAIKHPAGADK